MKFQKYVKIVVEDSFIDLRITGIRGLNGKKPS